MEVINGVVTQSLILGILVMGILYSINLGLSTTDLKLITSFVIILFLSLGHFKNPMDKRKNFSIRRCLHVENSKTVKEIS